MTHGNITERIIFTKMTPQEIGKPGAILNHLVSFSRATLAASCSSFETTHADVQEVFYVVKGKGSITVEGRQSVIRDGDAILIPPNSKHVIANTDNETMELLVTIGSVPSDKLKTAIHQFVVKNWRDSATTVAHWNDIVRKLLDDTDGLVNISAVITVEIDGMQVCEPHNHAPRGDELWYLLEGQVLHWVGRELRRQHAGSVVAVHPSEYTHSQINPTKEPAKFFYVSRIGPQ